MQHSLSFHCPKSTYCTPNSHSTPSLSLNTTWAITSSLKFQKNRNKFSRINCCSETGTNNSNNNGSLRTCKNCKTQFDPALNNPLACRFHSSHFGGETKRKFESVYSGGTLNTPDSGQVFEYWHCCGSEDPFDPGCTASPHLSYDD